MRRGNERLVELTVEIGGHQQARENEITRVCMVEWAFRNDDFYHRPTDDGKDQLLEASALGTLYASDELDDIIQRMERAIWRANGGMCHVEVRAMNLGNPPEWNAAIESEPQVA